MQYTDQASKFTKIQQILKLLPLHVQTCSWKQLHFLDIPEYWIASLSIQLYMGIPREKIYVF